ncbi:hypothetical protein BsWGS_18903 [Bradybaena similaris]
MAAGVLCAAVGVVLVAVVAADPTQCCWATQWEGIIQEKLGVYNSINNFASIADISSIIHVDYRRKMIVNEMSITNDSTNTVLTSIEDFNKRITYTIVGMYCVISNLTVSMGGNCVPENAGYLSTINIARVPSDIWFLNNNGSTARLTVSQSGCVPIQEVGVTLGDVSYLNIINVQNVTAGIADPTIFNVPQICNQTAIQHRTHPFAKILSMPSLIKHKLVNKINT